MSAAVDVAMLAGVRVLIVEDEYLIAEHMASACEAAGGTVAGPYSSSESAVRVAEEQRCDVAILDIRLGDQNSYEVAEALRGRGIPFVFATGYDARVLPRAMRNVPIWQKPYSAAFVVQGLATMLDLQARPSRWPSATT